MHLEQAAAAWMRRQAKEIAPDIIQEDESILLCSRVISNRIDELERFVGDVIQSESGNIFLLDRAKKLFKS